MGKRMSDYTSMTDAELDALAAERVMGWATDGPDDDLPIAMWHEKHLGHICAVTEWRPTTDPRDWWMVLHAMREKGWDWEIDHIQYRHESRCYAVFFWTSDDTRNHESTHSAANLGHAIVIAALIAVEIGEDSE